VPARGWLSTVRDDDMLRITSHFTGDEHVLQLEGCLAGPWVRELARSWGVAIASAHREHVALDMQDVCYVDDAGRDLLAAMHREGVRFVAAGLVTRELVHEIAQAAARDQRSRLCSS
jgi:anti-anti-sigma regulatory factor